MRRRPLRTERLIADHCAWLDGRAPSTAVRSVERDFSEAPIAHWLSEHERQLAVQLKRARPYNNREAADRRAE